MKKTLTIFLFTFSPFSFSPSFRPSLLSHSPSPSLSLNPSLSFSRMIEREREDERKMILHSITNISLVYELFIRIHHSFNRNWFGSSLLTPPHFFFTLPISLFSLPCLFIPSLPFSFSSFFSLTLFLFLSFSLPPLSSVSLLIWLIGGYLKGVQIIGCENDRMIMDWERKRISMLMDE
jgi:hypothetical protein